MLKDALTGFLSPDGEFTPCSYMEHAKVSENILKQLNKPIVNPEEDLANMGWMFLQVNFAGIPSTNGNIPLTDAQVKWIVENYDSLNKQQHTYKKCAVLFNTLKINKYVHAKFCLSLDKLNHKLQPACH